MVLSLGNEWLIPAAFLGQPEALHICQTLLERELEGIKRQRLMQGGAARVSFFHWAIQLHSDWAPRWESGSCLQKDECWCLTSCCIWAQKLWQGKPTLIWKKRKKGFEFHLPAQSSAPPSLPPTDHVGLQPARTGLLDRAVSPWNPPVLPFILLDGPLTADITQCCCALRL